jgi:hypothetical protein
MELIFTLFSAIICNGKGEEKMKMYSTIVGVLVATLAFISGASAPVDAVTDNKMVVSICGSAGLVPETETSPKCP